MKSTTILLFLSFIVIISNATDGLSGKKKDHHFIAPFISTYTEFVSDCSTGDRTLNNVQMSANPGLPITGSFVPRVYFRKSTSGTWASRPGTLVSGNATISTWSFTLVMADIGGLVTGDVVQYYIIAQSTDATPAIASRPAGVVATDVNTVTTAPSAPSSFTVGPTLNGTYTIGVGGDYPNLRTAISAYNISCLTGPVVFNLTDAAYTENTQLTINANPQASATNTLTIKPANGVIATITGNVVQHFIRIMGSHVTIDGNNGSAGRNLTINDINVQSIPITILSEDDRNKTIENVNIRNLTTINASFNYAGIMLSLRPIPGNDGYFKDVRIQNCKVQNAYYGICAFLVSGVGNGSGIDISDNDLSSTGSAAIRRYGIYVKGGESITIKRNLIGNINGSTHDEDDAGIVLGSGFRNSVVDGNKIFNLNYTGSAGHGAQGILVSLGITNANVTISNNFISNITGDGFEPAAYLAEPVGIMLSGPNDQSGINIFHNTIHLYGNTLRYTRAFSAGVYLSISSAAVIKNNIFVNKLGASGSASSPASGGPLGAVGVYVESALSQLTAIDNNDYYIASTGVAENYIGKIGSSTYTTLAAWQTATGAESHAKNIQPVFVSNLDLHLVPASNGLLDNLGTPVGISTDIDNDTRNGTTPDIGADEFTGVCISPSIDVPPTTQTVCAGSTLSLSVTATGTGLSYQWRKDGNNITTATNASYTVNSVNATNNGSYDVVITGTCGNVTSTPVSVLVNTAPAITNQPENKTVCAGTAVTLSVTATGTGLNYQWRRNGITIGSATSDNTYTIAPVGTNDAGSYDVIVSGTCTPSVTSSPATLTIDVPPFITKNPEYIETCIGTPASFSVTATGNGLTYQWRKDGNPIPSATSSTYTINSVSAADAGSYDVVVYGTCTPPMATSPVTLSFLVPPGITNHPANKTVCAGSPVTFSVTATGSGLTYQWRKGGNPIASATSSTYTISTVTAADAGSYDVVVSGSCTPSVISNPAVLSLPATNSWLGTISSDWTNPLNWCLGLPNSTSDITINSGTPFSPIVNAAAVNIHNLEIAGGATVTLIAGGWLNIYGSFTNNGTFAGTDGNITFWGPNNHTISGFSIGSLILNTAGSVTPSGNIAVAGTLSLTSGNILLGNNNITLNNPVLGGSVASHIVTNGTGNVIFNGINVPTITLPIGVDAVSINTVYITNGGGKNYTVNVKTGVNPAILTSSLAINRTWTIIPNSTPAFNPEITLQYADADGNSGANGGGLMEVGVHNGTSWQIASPGVSPFGSPTARKITYTNSLFGPTVVTNPGGLSYPLAVSGLDPSISSIQLLPNVVSRQTLLRVKSSKAMKTDWILTDMNGKIIRTFSKLVITGTNDISLDLGYLPMGVYQLKGITQKGTTGVLRLVKF